MHVNLLIPFGLGSLLLFAAPATADWPHWRGPGRNGVSAEDSGFRDGRLSIDTPAWRANVGKGSSSPLVIADRLYTMGWKDGKDVVQCLDAATGNELWSQSYPCPLFGRKALGDQNQYAGPSSTPEYDQATGFLYTLSIDGHLHCWNTAKEGAKVWGLQLHEKYRVQQRPRVGQSGHRDYGFTTAPLVHGDWLLLEVGASEGTVISFDKRTGAEVWRSQLADPSGHTGGLAPMSIEGIPCVAVLSHFQLAVLRLDKGQEGQTLASHPWVTDFSNSIATPAVHGPHVLITSAYNQMKLCKLKITLKGAERLWEKKYPSGVCSPVIHKGRIYLAWRTIRCLDFETGEQLWAGENTKAPGSCIVTADDRLIVWADSGRLLLLETAERSPRELKILAQNDKVLSDLAWPHVVLSAGRIYCKDRGGNLVCFQVGK